MAIDIESEQQPLVTFIVTNYNLPVAFLQECLDSILALSLDDAEREIILVDDGSREPIRKHLQEYRKHVRFFYQDNQGLSAARNLGIEHANGKFLQFVDGDDALIADNYNNIINKVRNCEAEIFLFRFSEKKDVKDHVISDNVLSTDAWSRAHNLRAAAWGYLFRRELLSNGLRFTPGIYHEDEAFTPFLFDSSTTICDTGVTAYYYRQREGSITSEQSKKHLEKRFNDMFDVILMLRKGAEETGSYLLTRRYRQLTMDFLYSVMTLTKSKEKTEHYVEKLRHEGLFPLHVSKEYTQKYHLFSLLTKHHLLRQLFLRIAQ